TTLPGEASSQVILVVGAHCGRGDCGFGRYAEAWIEWHWKRRHGRALRIGEHMLEHTTSHVVRIPKCIANARDNRAATISPGEPRTPGICRLRCNDCGNASFRRCGIFRIVTKPLLQPDKITERFPKLLLKRRSRNHLAVLGGVEPIARRAAGDVALPIAWPNTRDEAVADCPEHERKQIVGHRHIEVTPV